MSDRHAELRRQRALVAEHLAWLDHEISAASGAVPTAPSSPLSAPTGATTPASAAPITTTGVNEPSIEDIVKLYRPAAETTPADARKGCLWAFAIGMSLLIGTVAALYWFRYR